MDPEDATAGLDPVYDAKSIFSSDELNITTLIGNIAYIIQGRPLTSDTDIIALNFETNTEGAHQLIFDFEYLPTDQIVSLYDTYISKVYDLNISNTYKFMSNAGNFSDRFQLITGNKTIKTFDENLNTTVAYTFSNNEVNLKSAQSIQSIVIYSFQGKILDEMIFESQEKSRSFRMKNYKENLIILRATDIHGKSDVQKFLLK